MKSKIISQFDNKLFSRNELVLEVEADVVPSKEEVKEFISKEFSCDKDLIRVREIKGKFGVRVFKVVADIYSSKEEFDRIVKKTKQEIEAEKKAEEERLKAEEEARKAAEEAKKAEEAESSEKSQEGEKSAEESQEETSKEEAKE
jgi:ribosomal protein S24E